MSERTQAYRQVAIGTPLGEDVLLFRRATIHEQLGRPFHMEVDLLSEDPDIDFNKIVGQNVTIRLETQAGQPRYFNGQVSRFVHTGGSARSAHYRMELVPWLWFLTRTADCRIFQNMTVPDIIMAVFRKNTDAQFANALKGTYNPRQYCVQYRETDFNFVSRLMEHEGIYYYFDHQNGKHTLVLADSYGSHEAYPDYAQMPYFPPTRENREQEYISEWIVEQEVQPGAYVHTDYNFEKPKQDMVGTAQVVREHALAGYEYFDYPGCYGEQADGDSISKVRLEERQARHETVRGRADVRGLCTGYTFTLSGLSRESQNKEHLVTGATYEIVSDEYQSTMGEDDEGPIYSCQFTALLASQQYRPERITPKPVVHGPQTAFVTGPKGEEIHTDEHGRVKVQFHWDRQGKGDDTTSCWIRVAQVWTGKEWGAMNIPRVGQEVIVEFLEGDPDRPIITGRVYNGVSKPAYALPDYKTMMSFKSATHKGSGFNEIRFEDKKGEEQVFIHGEHNQDIRIKNDAFETIGASRHLTIGTDQIEEVGHDKHQTVKHDQCEEIVNNHQLTIGNNQVMEVGGSQSLTVKGDVIEAFKARHTEETATQYVLVSKEIVIKGTGNVTVRVGANTIAINDGGIKLEAGGASLTLQKDGTVDLKGVNVAIKGASVAIN